MTLFLLEYSYILFAIYVIITIISVYIALHCNDVFSFETFTALVVPYIYLPLDIILKISVICLQKCVLHINTFYYD